MKTTMKFAAFLVLFYATTTGAFTCFHTGENVKGTCDGQPMENTGAAQEMCFVWAFNKDFNTDGNEFKAGMILMAGCVPEDYDPTQASPELEKEFKAMDKPACYLQNDQVFGGSGEVTELVQICLCYTDKCTDGLVDNTGDQPMMKEDAFVATHECNQFAKQDNDECKESDAGDAAEALRHTCDAFNRSNECTENNEHGGMNSTCSDPATKDACEAVDKRTDGDEAGEDCDFGEDGEACCKWWPERADKQADCVADTLCQWKADRCQPNDDWVDPSCHWRAEDDSRGCVRNSINHHSDLCNSEVPDQEACEAVVNDGSGDLDKCELNEKCCKWLAPFADTAAKKTACETDDLCVFKAKGVTALECTAVDGDKKSGGAGYIQAAALTAAAAAAAAIVL